ncbi:MAG: hypothetical protein ABII76_15565 [Pseudomonadota bacterium]
MHIRDIPDARVGAEPTIERDDVLPSTVEQHLDIPITLGRSGGLLMAAFCGCVVAGHAASLASKGQMFALIVERVAQRLKASQQKI